MVGFSPPYASGSNPIPDSPDFSIMVASNSSPGRGQKFQYPLVDSTDNGCQPPGLESGDPSSSVPRVMYGHFFPCESVKARAQAANKSACNPETDGLTEAVLKRWIPNTNFENSSNWNEQRVPCSQDNVIFAKEKKVSVLVQSTHSLTAMLLPMDGEFILSHGAGFQSASRGDSECGEGSFINFQDSDQFQWYDPTLWQAALSTDDLENGRFLSAVDAERVPCTYDDVLFSPGTSFRVHVEEASEVQLRSITVLGRRFTSNEEFALYAQSPTGKLQFPRPALPHVTNTKCQDKTGCVCNDGKMLQVICSALLRHTDDNKCPNVSCANALRPAGQCCDICGVIITLEYTSDFDLDTYRSRLIHAFLSLAKYSTVELAISKVENTPLSLGKIPLASELKIQIVITDKRVGSVAGRTVQQLAGDIMADITAHGQSFGITKAEMQSATDVATGAQNGSMTPAGISGIVFGIVLGVSLMGTIFFLYRMDAFRLQYFRLFWFWRNAPREEAAFENTGFNNPIFEPAPETIQVTPASYTGDDELKGVSLQQSGIYFSNPLFDSDLDV
ncbi:protein amnionless [Pseudophryne corroboree]|uniref:protein amnionless n=1 Tax=Pseudophryne corroboree TaxID=495146 RepID=UPI003081236C